LKTQKGKKSEEIESIKAEIVSLEEQINTLQKRVKELDSRQAAIKKIEEFNALTQEMTAAEREKKMAEQKLSHLVDSRIYEEEVLQKIEKQLKTAAESSIEVASEINLSISAINAEGSELKERRDLLAKTVDKEVFAVYERLLKNKRDRVIVPLENRTCSGCHIALTPQHENLVRKGDNLVFCEHCSRIHYWQEADALEGTTAAPRRRRRKVATTT